MAKARTINSTLAKIFEQSSSVAYLVSPSQTISFANRACADWVGVDLESLVGTRTVYTTDRLEDEFEEKAKGLALDASQFSAQSSDRASELSAVRVSAFKNNTLCWRDATVSHLYDDDGKLLGLIVIASAKDTSEPCTLSEFDSTALHQTIANIRSADQARYQLKNLIGRSAAMKRVNRQSHSTAQCDCDFVVVGPPGSGREHLAKAIYNERVSTEPIHGQGDLIPIHCAITDPLQIQQTMKELVSERKKRSAEMVVGGKTDVTVLLIDVDRLKESSQLELLGFLDLPGFSFHAIATAETNLLMADAVKGDGEATRFNRELAARLSTMVIELPSLKQRREDLPLLAQAILEQNNSRAAQQLSKFSNDAMDLLCEFDWPRNFDQLVSTIDAAAKSAKGSQVEVGDLPEKFRQSLEAQRVGEAKEVHIKLDDYLAGIEVELVKRALAHTKGNKTRASKMLGVSRPKLLRRLQHFGLMNTAASGDDEEMLDASVFKEADVKEGRE